MQGKQSTGRPLRADQNNKINNPTRSGSHHAEDVTSACGNPVSPMLEWILLRTVRMLSRHRPRQSRSPLPLLLLLALPHGPVITRPAVNAQTLISYLSHTPHHYTQWVGGENITSLQGILIVRWGWVLCVLLVVAPLQSCRCIPSGNAGSLLPPVFRIPSPFRAPSPPWHERIPTSSSARQVETINEMTNACTLSPSPTGVHDQCQLPCKHCISPQSLLIIDKTRTTQHITLHTSFSHITLRHFHPTHIDVTRH